MNKLKLKLARVHVYVVFSVPSKENKNLGNSAAIISSNIKIQLPLLLSFG